MPHVLIQADLCGPKAGPSLRNGGPRGRRLQIHSGLKPGSQKWQAYGQGYPAALCTPAHHRSALLTPESANTVSKSTSQVSHIGDPRPLVDGNPPTGLVEPRWGPRSEQLLVALVMPGPRWSFPGPGRKRRRPCRTPRGPGLSSGRLACGL